MNAFDETTLTTARLVLTPLRQADADVMVDVLADRRLHEFIGGQPASHAELHERYGRLDAGSPRPDEIWLNWVVRRRAGHTPVGTVQATVNREPGGWTAHVAWVIGLPWQGQGFASEAAAPSSTGCGTRARPPSPPPSIPTTRRRPRSRHGPA